MEQYIKKSDIVAEIERRLEAIASSSNENNRELSAIYGAQQFELINLALFINNLEVKEVDLEKELKRLIGNVGQCDKKLAKHFFELGLKAKQD